MEILPYFTEVTVHSFDLTRTVMLTGKELQHLGRFYEVSSCTAEDGKLFGAACIAGKLSSCAADDGGRSWFFEGSDMRARRKPHCQGITESRMDQDLRRKEKLRRQDGIRFRNGQAARTVIRRYFHWILRTGRTRSNFCQGRHPGSWHRGRKGNFRCTT